MNDIERKWDEYLREHLNEFRLSEISAAKIAFYAGARCGMLVQTAHFNETFDAVMNLLDKERAKCQETNQQAP